MSMFALYENDSNEPILFWPVDFLVFSNPRDGKRHRHTVVLRDQDQGIIGTNPFPHAFGAELFIRCPQIGFQTWTFFQGKPSFFPVKLTLEAKQDRNVSDASFPN